MMPNAIGRYTLGDRTPNLTTWAALLRPESAAYIPLGCEPLKPNQAI